MEASKFLDAGDLVPTEITNRMVEARVAEPDAEHGFVLDGFPRTVGQAEALEAILAEIGAQLDAVLSLCVDEDDVVQRMLARGRADDNDQVIRNRLQVYREETAPLLAHYDSLVVNVGGVGKVEEVSARAMNALRYRSSRHER